MPPKPKNETTLAKLTAFLSAQGVTAITVVDSDAVPDPAWFVVAHPAEVLLKVDFTPEATAEQKAAAKTAIAAAKLKTRNKHKSAAGAVKEIAKLTVERQERLGMLVLAMFVLDESRKALLEKWGFGDMDLDETVVL